MTDASPGARAAKAGGPREQQLELLKEQSGTHERRDQLVSSFDHEGFALFRKGLAVRRMPDGDLAHELACARCGEEEFQRCVSSICGLLDQAASA